MPKLPCLRPPVHESVPVPGECPAFTMERLSQLPLKGRGRQNRKNRHNMLGAGHPAAGHKWAWLRPRTFGTRQSPVDKLMTAINAWRLRGFDRHWKIRGDNRLTVNSPSSMATTICLSPAVTALSTTKMSPLVIPASRIESPRALTKKVEVGFLTSCSLRSMDFST